MQQKNPDIDPDEKDPVWEAYKERERLKKAQELKEIMAKNLAGTTEVDYVCKRISCQKHVYQELFKLYANVLVRSGLCPECYEEYVESETKP